MGNAQFPTDRRYHVIRFDAELGNKTEIEAPFLPLGNRVSPCTLTAAPNSRRFITT